MHAPLQRTATSLLLNEGLGQRVRVVQVRAARVGQRVLGEVVVVAAAHPDPVRVPRQAVLGDPGAATLGAATVEVSGDGVGVLLALALTGGLHPLDGVTLGLDADGARVLEDDHRDDGPQGQERRHDPHGELLQPRPIWRVVLRKVAVVDGMEDTCRQKGPMLPVVAMVPNRLVQRVLLRRAVGLELRRRRRRHVQVRGRTSQAGGRGGHAVAAPEERECLAARIHRNHGANARGPGINDASSSAPP
mmetsp:Transcript_96773/g.260209  ORF Transcript_96773/g.260209 Transcript_96773/m.260209 type:complete len:247 (-) Transcript_96773:7-747(-)